MNSTLRKYSGTAYLRVLAAFIVTLLVISPALAAPGDLDDGFNPDLNNTVFTTVLLPDGKVLIGGTFTTVDGVPRNRIARLDQEGALDVDFSQDAALPENMSIRAMAVQADGKIVIGGLFTTVGGTFTTIARLTPDGGIDPGFRPNLNGEVNSIAVQPDGKILIGGHFTTVEGTVRNRVARLNPDGTLDGEFDPDVGGLFGFASVESIAIQPDGKILIGGWFTRLGATNRTYVGRVNTDGSVDATFAPDPGSGVLSMSVQPDGKIIIGGAFTNVADTARNRIARLNSDGSLDPGFDPNVDNFVESIKVQADGKIVIGGSFTAVGGTTRNRISRLNTNGTVDTGFDPNANGEVLSLAVQLDARIIIGGNFTIVGAETNRNRCTRLNADGTPDIGFRHSVAGYVVASVVQGDGAILIAGSFSAVDGITRSNLARINRDGTLDMSFHPDVASAGILAVQADGKILIGGGGISRLNGDGTLDTGFNCNVTGGVFGIALQPDGKILIRSLSAISVNGTPISRAQQPARLNTDGSLDRIYDSATPATNDYITTFALQADGKVLKALYRFNLIYVTNGFYYDLGSSIERWTADDGLDTTFQDQGSLYWTNNAVGGLTVQSDGRILVSYAYSDGGGCPDAYTLRLNANGTDDATFSRGFFRAIALQTDGKILTSECGFHRRHTNGLSDAQFTARFGFSGALIQADGKIVVRDPSGFAGGQLLLRLKNDLATSSLTLDSANRITWLRGGSSPEAQDVSFGVSTNGGTSWTSLDVGTRIVGGWELTGLSLPTNGLVRALARVAGDGFSQSSGLVEQVLVIPATNHLAVNEDATNSINDLQSVFASNLVYSVENNNPTLVAATVNNTNRTLTLEYQTNQFGTATIKVGAVSRGHLLEKTFVLTVNPVNDVPVVDFLTNLVTVASGNGSNSLIGFATFTVGPTNESAQTLVGHTVTNDNPGLFFTPPAIDTNGTLTFTPWLFVGGTATVSVVTMDNGGTVNGGVDKGTNTFTIVVIQSVFINPPAVENPIADFAVNEDAANNLIGLRAVFASVNTPDADLVYQLASNSNPALVSATVNNTSDSLTLHFQANQNGVATFTVRASDYYWSYAEDTFVVTVNPVNDAPVVTLGPAVVVAEDAGAQSRSGFAIFSPGPANESDQSLVGYTVNNNNSALFSVQPTINNGGTLTFTPATEVSGSATVTVSSQDSGGTANGGVDTSISRTFTITVAAVNDAPLLTLGPNVTLLEDGGAQSVSGFATFSPGPTNESGQSLAGYTLNNSSNALFSVQPAINTAGLLTFTPATDANGSASVTVVAQDNGGTANGGVDKGTNVFTISVTPVNDAPDVTFASSVVVVAPVANALTFSSFAAFTPGPANETAQVGSSRVDLQACKLEYSIVSPK